MVALLTLIVDQATKLYFLFVFDLPVREPVVVDSLRQPDRGLEPGHLLWPVPAAVGSGSLDPDRRFGPRRCGPVRVDPPHTRSRFLAVALALIVGGAIGNVIDRWAYGAVFDFIQMKIGAWSWYVFNVADAAIVAGVVGLLYDSFVLERRRVA